MGETTLADVERLADQLPVEEQISLVEHVARRVRLAMRQVAPQDLRGIWREHFPTDLDLEAALREIRHE
jgi:hypothetical protein